MFHVQARRQKATRPGIPGWWYGRALFGLFLIHGGAERRSTSGGLPGTPQTTTKMQVHHAAPHALQVCSLSNPKYRLFWGKVQAHPAHRVDFQRGALPPCPAGTVFCPFSQQNAVKKYDFSSVFVRFVLKSMTSLSFFIKEKAFYCTFFFLVFIRQATYSPSSSKTPTPLHITPSFSPGVI